MDIRSIQFGDEEFARLTRYCNIIDERGDGVRRAALLGLGKPGVSVANGAVVRLGAKGSIGENVFVGLYCYINGAVTIEDNVLFGPGCAVTAGHHKFDPATGWFSARTERDGDDSVVIGAGTWLCAHVTVTAGVKIGRANLICAGAVVTKSTPDYAIIAGVPARQVGRIDPVTGEYIWA
jgi:acetyltransferase-like isoleucine patch superfamily enzyme